ncbi:hypothetical protein ALC62_10899 [Cyphomyrmex costatus]|uniref:Uncharacterized protein n=1 Tax=Cyphomyrmex costatus TaxID=456900 RepID=A0A151IDB1_9HYME|nr:hypothetical protein ALC62_10899 [Cyphomyrmex costatus]
MRSFSRNGGLYYHMQQRLYNMHLVYPLFVFRDSQRTLEELIRVNVAYVENRCRNIEEYVRTIFRDT